VLGLERGPLSLMSTIEELLERKSSGSGLEIREYGRRDLSRWPRSTICAQKLELTSPSSGGRSVGIVRSRTQATGFSFFFFLVIGLYGKNTFEKSPLNEHRIYQERTYIYFIHEGRIFVRFVTNSLFT
jgi:hypothetical protein